MAERADREVIATRAGVGRIDIPTEAATDLHFGRSLDGAHGEDGFRSEDASAIEFAAIEYAT